MAVRLKFWPTVFTLPALCVLIGLGSWQVDRLFWKQELLSRLQERGTAEPITLPAHLHDLEKFEYRRVRVEGKLLHQNEFYLVNRSLNGNPGLNVITPLERSDGEGFILVNRGWVPFGKRQQHTRKLGQIEGKIIIDGIIRLTKGPGLFTPNNEPHNNTWFYINSSGMLASVGLTSLQDFYLLAANQSPGGLPIGHQWRVDLRNAHLEYSITWFALAVSLLVIYIIYHRQEKSSDSK